MKKAKLIQLALKSPRAPQSLQTATVADFVGCRLNNVLFRMFFEQVSGLSAEDTKFTIRNFEYPEHIEDEKAEQVNQWLLARGHIPFGYNEDGSKIILEA